VSNPSGGFDRTILEYRHLVPFEPPDAWLTITPELLSEDDEGCE
jgi:hypothetical protein